MGWPTNEPRTNKPSRLLLGAIVVAPLLLAGTAAAGSSRDAYQAEPDSAAVQVVGLGDHTGLDQPDRPDKPKRPKEPRPEKPEPEQPEPEQPEPEQPEPEPEQPFDFVLGPDETLPSPEWTKPALYATQPDPAYGLDVTRVTSADGTRFDRNTYSRRQNENIDGTLFMTYHGSARYHVYDTASGRLESSLDIHPGADPQWHPFQPHYIRHLSGDDGRSGSLQLWQTNVLTGSTSVRADLAGPLADLLPGAVYLSDGAEGSPSADGAIYAWNVFDRDEQFLGSVTYDIDAQELLGVRTEFGSTITTGPDAISVSPTGRWVVAQFNDVTLQYPTDFSLERVVLPGGEHSDIARGRDGHDHYVYVDYTRSENAGWVMSYDLDTRTYTRLFDLYDGNTTSVHFSGKAYDNPGWVVVSTYNCKVDQAWTCDKVFLVDVHSGAIVNLAHTYNCGNNYWTEAHAVASRDLSRVYFNSDAGSCGIDAEVYRIDVPQLTSLTQPLSADGGGN